MSNLSDILATPNDIKLKADKVTIVPSGAISATDVQNAFTELVNKKQDTLVSGTNIVSINNTPLIGSGNFTIETSGASGAGIKEGLIIRTSKSTPDGFLPCNGALLDQATYPDLYAAVGDRFDYYANRYINGQPWRQQYKTNMVDNGDITGWTAVGSLPGALHYLNAIVTNSRVYILGGRNVSTDVTTVYTAPINADGTLGVWTTGTSLPGNMTYSAPIVTNSRVYLLGGLNGPTAVATVYTAPINADGTLGAWTTGTALPGALAYSQAVVTNSRVYLLGGNNGAAVSTVYTAPINADGTLGTWSTGTSLPGVLYCSQAIVTNNRVYLLGGYTSTHIATVYTASINSDGTLGAWTLGPALPGALYVSQAVATNSRVYLLGGYAATNISTVYTAPINSDGTLGIWTTGTSLLGPVYGSQAIVTNSRIYLLGGSELFTTSSATVYSAPLSGGKNNYLDDTFYRQNYYSNGQPWRQQYQINKISNGDITGWTTDTSLPIALRLSQAIVTNSRVYLLGGYTTESVSTVYTAPINPDGTLGTWSTGTSLPGVLYGSSAIVTNSRVYLLGGYTTASVSTVYTAPINPDGTLGTWTTGTALPGILSSSQAIVTNSRVYLLGGITGGYVATVYTAPINSDGTLGAWTTGTSLPGALSRSQAIVTNSRVYLLGGLSTGDLNVSTVYTAPINSDGTLGTWATGTALPGVLGVTSAITTNSRVYLLGGESTSRVSTVYTASINSDGTLGTWTTGTALPGVLGYSSSVVTNSRVYLLGGYNTALTEVVYSAPLSGGLNNYLDKTQQLGIEGKFYIPDLINEEATVLNNTTVRSYIKY